MTSQYSGWADVERRIRESRPEASDAEWGSRERAARTATEAYVAEHRPRTRKCPEPEPQ
ncbi:hypothetical protein ACFUIT_09670 [Streptomyces sp. NPDC057239]|uniref:hypothetical protein n=1 Tax=Streptomyces sp. NPDC057239 TaxID=3346061 RepID=UPI00363EB3E2